MLPMTGPFEPSRLGPFRLLGFWCALGLLRRLRRDRGSRPARMPAARRGLRLGLRGGASGLGLFSVTLGLAGLALAAEGAGPAAASAATGPSAATSASRGAPPQLAPSALRVEQAWARATVPGQRASGAFMQLTATQGLTLVGVSSPLAGVAEIHAMKLENDIMRMSAVPQLELPAGQTVSLRPGGLHVMLLDLKSPLTSGSVLPLRLLLQDTHGAQRVRQLNLPVGLQPPRATPADASGTPLPVHHHGS